jgi:hypothetical protein
MTHNISNYQSWLKGDTSLLICYQGMLDFHILLYIGEKSPLSFQSTGHPHSIVFTHTSFPNLSTAEILQQ